MPMLALGEPDEYPVANWVPFFCGAVLGIAFPAPHLVPELAREHTIFLGWIVHGIALSAYS